MGIPGIDPFAAARRALRGVESALLERILETGSSAAAAAASRTRASVAATTHGLMTMLGRIPHAAANRLVDMDRGRHARPPTGAEARSLPRLMACEFRPEM